jgi:hypothetical protein
MLRQIEVMGNALRAHLVKKNPLARVARGSVTVPQRGAGLEHEKARD